MPCAVLALCAGLSERERNSTFKLLSSSSSPAVHPPNYTLNLKYDLEYKHNMPHACIMHGVQYTGTARRGPRSARY